MNRSAGCSFPPTVSIGLPVYNGARFIAHALDSLLGQSFFNFELIISDNASTDETEKICKGFAERDQRIRYIRQHVNIGAPRNWNFVAEEARGKYFKWSSASDYCAPDMLALCVAAMELDVEVVLCYGRTCLVDEETGALEEYSGDIAITDDCPHDRFRTLCQTLMLNNAQSGLIRTDALRRTQLDRLYPGGDVALMAELALLGKFLLLPEVLLYRRTGRETFSSRLNATELSLFFDPQKTHSIDLRRLRLNVDFFRVVFRSPISIPEKWKTLQLVFRHAIWDRENLWAELRGVLGNFHR
jgi:glycosyltransferase involved in cell wall biosynthesis